MALNLSRNTKVFVSSANGVPTAGGAFLTGHVSTAGTGYRYTFAKSKRNHPERVEYRKYDPIIRKHVIFKETK